MYGRPPLPGRYSSATLFQVKYFLQFNKTGYPRKSIFLTLLKVKPTPRLSDWLWQGILTEGEGLVQLTSSLR